MTLHVTLAEAEATLAELLNRAEAGEDLVIRRDGKPNLKLRVEPELDAPPQGARGRRIGILAKCGPLADPDLYLRADPQMEADALDGPIFPTK